MSNFNQNSQILRFSAENSLFYCNYDSTGLSVRQPKRKNLLYIRKKFLYKKAQSFFLWDWSEAGCAWQRPYRYAFRSNQHGRLRHAIIAHATFNISAGRIEGMNNKIKTLRCNGYDYPDDDYFFLKLFDVSRKPYIRKSFIPQLL